MEQAVLVAEGEEIQARDLGLEAVDELGVRLELPEHLDDFHEALAEVQRLAEGTLLRRALADRTHAARALGLARRTLLYKLKDHGIE